MKISEDIMNRIKSVGRGNYFTADDFADIASPDTIRQNLSRLAKTGFLVRVANGFFHYPELFVASDITKPVSPTAYMHEYAKKHRFEIMYLDTSIFEMFEVENPYKDNMVFLTNGKSRTIRFIDTYDIRLVKTTNVSYFKYKSLHAAALVYVASRIGKDNLTQKQKVTIKNHFYSKDSSRAIHDLQFAPVWFKEIVRK